MITLLHNPGCSKSTLALDYSRVFPGLELRIRPYLQEPLNRDELLLLLEKLQLPVAGIVRTKDKDFVARFGTEAVPDDAYLNILVNHPQFLQRPILIDGDTAIIGRPPELVLDYLKQKMQQDQ